MRQIELTSKFVLAALVATIVAFSAITVPSVVAQSGPPQDGGGGPPDDFITSEMIGDGEVQTQDLADGAVTSAKIADGTIEEEDIADGVIPSGGTQPRLYIVSELFHVPADDPSVFFQVPCEEGDQVTGGGFSSSNTNAIVVHSSPSSDGSTWQVGVNAATLTFEVLFSVDAICLDLTP